jgi:ketosteroid isomerase-like protein
MDSVEQLAARYEKAWNSRDLDAIASLHTVDSVFQLHALGGQEVVGREAIRATFAAFVSQFPDLHFARERLRVGSSHWVFESKLTAASAEIEIDCIDVIDVGDALVARKDTYLDTAGVLAKPAEAFVEAFAEAWRAPGDADRFADHFEAWFDPHVRFVQYSMPTFTGREGFREQFARPLFALMPDLHGTVTRWAAVGDDVYIELRLEGTLGRRTVTLHSCDRITLRDGKVVERVAHLDPAPLMAAVKRAPRIWPQVLRAQRPARARAT